MAFLASFAAWLLLGLETWTRMQTSSIPIRDHPFMVTSNEESGESRGTVIALEGSDDGILE
jgi:hypothetical protein